MKLLNHQKVWCAGPTLCERCAQSALLPLHGICCHQLSKVLLKTASTTLTPRNAPLLLQQRCWNPTGNKRGGHTIISRHNSKHNSANPRNLTSSKEHPRSLAPRGQPHKLTLYKHRRRRTATCDPMALHTCLQHNTAACCCTAESAPSCAVCSSCRCMAAANQQPCHTEHQKGSSSTSRSPSSGTNEAMQLHERCQRNSQESIAI